MKVGEEPRMAPGVRLQSDSVRDPRIIQPFAAAMRGGSPHVVNSKRSCVTQ